MQQLADTLGTAFDLALVVFGFGLIIFVHELGHFLAARWAGIRVLAFAIGFGSAAISYRKGLGFRRGSSEPEYRRDHAKNPEISPTEYRLNWLPLGGYVKMLGQEDLDPTAVSAEPDSYQNRPAWKRMVVISAGVVMNMITAAALFILVFMVGLKTQPPIVGAAAPGSPAATVVATNAERLGVTEPGLQSGDRVVRAANKTADSFDDLILASAMSRRGKAVTLVVERPGVSEHLVFEIVPREGESTRLLEMGIEPARSTVLFDTDPGTRAAWDALADSIGISQVPPGATLTHANATPISRANDLARVFSESAGAPVALVFEHDGSEYTATLGATPALQTALVPVEPDRTMTLDHLLGFTPVMRVASADENGRGYKAGLREGDVFARVGSVEFPSITSGVREVRAHTGRDIELEVLRDTPTGETKRIPFTARVNAAGMIGFGVGDTSATSTLLAFAPDHTVVAPDTERKPWAAPGATAATRPGTRITAVSGSPVTDFASLRAALIDATEPARESSTAASVELSLELPLPGAPTERVELALSEQDIAELHALGWRSPIPLGLFEPAETLLKAEDPGEAIAMGVSETHRVMTMTYLTIARLFEGTVKVEHLKGPVGIAHLGTRIADRGIIWLLFFMALISVNLAVINFLPLPIVDGGQFLLLVYEQIRGRPAPVAFQNAVTLAGLVLIAAVFLVVTFHDVKNLFGV